MHKEEELQPDHSRGHEHPEHVSANVHADGNRITIVIDVAEHCRHDRPHPKPDPSVVLRYKIKVDDQELVVDESRLTGSQILALVGKTSKSHQLNQQRRIEGKPKPTRVAPNETVDFTERGIEKFMTLALDNTEGESINELALRRQFLLPAEDVEYLDATGMPWETVNSGGQCVILHNFPIPDGYTVPTTRLLVRLPSGYPRVPLDMVYVYPALRRADGQPIGALTPLILDGTAYEQWSRHRTSVNPWRMGVDSLVSHLEQAKVWFEQEFDKRPRLHAVLA